MNNTSQVVAYRSAKCPFCGCFSFTEGAGWNKGCEHAEGRIIEGHGPITLPITDIVTFYFAKTIIERKAVSTTSNDPLK